MFLCAGSELKRFKREVNQPVRVPDRIQLDAFTLDRAEKDFVDKFNREPDVEELSDHSKMPVTRITKVRRTFRQMPSQEAIGEGQSQSYTDFGNEALEYIYKYTTQYICIYISKQAPNIYKLKAVCYSFDLS